MSAEDVINGNLALGIELFTPYELEPKPCAAGWRNPHASVVP